MSEVAGEGGFEVGRGYLAVFPDATDFASALDEQLGGISVAVMVTPNTADFAAALDEQLGGLSATVGVGADTAEAQAQVDELLSEISGSSADLILGADTGPAMEQAEALAGQVSDLDAALNVGASTGGASEGIGALSGELEGLDSAAGEASGALSGTGERISALSSEAEGAAGAVSGLGAELAGLGAGFAGLAGAGLSGIPVRVTPDVSDFAAALDEETGGLVVGAKVIPDTSDFAAAVDEQVGAEAIAIPVTADTSGATAALADLEAEAADDSGIQTLYNGILSIGPAATHAEMEAVDALDGIRGAVSAVSADAVTEEFATIGPAASSGAAEAGQALGSIGEDAAAARGGIETFLGGIYSIGPAATQAEQEAATAFRQLTADSFGSVDYTAVTAGLNDVTAAETATAASSDAVAASASHTAGIFGLLSGAMTEVATNPFVWMGAAVAGGILLGVELDNVTNGIRSQIAALTQEYDATGYNISGYKNLAAALGEQTAALNDDIAAGRVQGSATALVGQALGDAETRTRALTSAQQQAITIIDNLTGHVGTLEEKYGISATQAEDLATAAGVSYKQLEGSGDAADKAMAKIEAYANANLSATGPVSELADDVSVFGNDALTASARVSALTDSYNLLVGNFVSAQTDMLSVRQDFLGIESAASIAGASMGGTNTQSVSLQQSFYATAGAIQQTAQAMLNAKDPTSEITAYIQEQTDKLSGLTGGNQQAQQAVEGLREWEDRLTSSVDATDRAVNQASTDLQSKFITQLDAAGAKSKTVTGGVNELADSILATGTRSDETAADRAQLIKDLEQAGINAQKATTLVDAFIKKIGQIPAHVSLSLTETATGTWSIEGSAAAGTAEATHAGGGDTRFVQSAGGGHITGGSRRPRADDIHAMLSHNEYVVQSDAVDHYGVGFLDSVNAMHFAGGGYAGDLSGLAGFIGAGYLSTANTLTQAIEAAVTAAIAAAKDSSTSDKPPVIVNFNGTQYPTPSQRQALMMELAAAIGVS